MTILSSDRVTSTTLIRQSFANLYNLINNRANVPDPNDSSGKRKFVYQRFPDIKSLRFQGYPFIVVSRSKPSKKLGTADLTKSFISFDFFISIYAREKGGNELGEYVGANTSDIITDAVRSTLDSVSNQKTLINQGMANLEYNIDPSEDEDLDGELVYVSEFDIRFNNNLTTTG